MEATCNMLSRIFRPIKEGFFGVGRHAAMSLSSASAVTITLFIIGIFLIFTANVQSFTLNIEQSMEISVLIDYDHEQQEQLDAIGLAIGNIDGVRSVNFSDKDQEFQYYIDSFEDEEEQAIFEPFREDNPMHHAYYVEVYDGDNLETIANQISQIEGVYEVNYGGESSVTLVNVINSVRNGGAILAIALSLLAVFLIQNTIKVTILARADEIAIMRNVGAKNGFIRSPFLVEGIIIGILGAIIPILCMIFGYIYLYDALGGVVISNMFTLIAPHPFVLYLALILIGVGIVVGFIGSWLSVNKYLRWKR